MRPYVLGLNNPQGNPPLSVDPPGGTGDRLWRMINEAGGVSAEDWLKGTQRANLLSDPVLPRDYKSAANRRGEYLATLIASRTVIVLGQVVATPVGHTEPPLVWNKERNWVMIPHPSGRNMFYNNPVHRAAVGALLNDVWLDSREVA